MPKKIGGNAVFEAREQGSFEMNGIGSLSTVVGGGYTVELSGSALLAYDLNGVMNDVLVSSPVFDAYIRSAKHTPNISSDEKINYITHSSGGTKDIQFSPFNRQLTAYNGEVSISFPIKELFHMLKWSVSSSMPQRSPGAEVALAALEHIQKSRFDKTRFKPYM